MNKNKHLVRSDRDTIKSMLDENCNFTQIAEAIGKARTTISREVRNRSVYVRKNTKYAIYNACKHRFSCEKKHVCSTCERSGRIRQVKFCRKCNLCNFRCNDFLPDPCPKLNRSPFVCNGCGYSSGCSLEKKYYYADQADDKYRTLLSESRSGISYSEEELMELSDLVTPLIKKNQSPHHICITNTDVLNVSERTLYRLINANALDAINLDLQRKVRFRPRKVTVHVKVDKKCRVGRTFDDFKNYLKEHPDVLITQLDSVEGEKGGKVLLTIHFTKAEFMLAFLREHNDSRSVTDIFNHLFGILDKNNFSKIFKVCLADNGTEFSDPTAIEYDSDGNKRTTVFYCDPNAPFQKGSAERNHEFIRLFFPKGTDFSGYSQDDINLMMNHINSYARESLGDKSPYEMFAFLYGQDILDLLGAKLIPPQEITLSKAVFRKEVTDHDLQ